MTEQGPRPLGEMISLAEVLQRDLDRHVAEDHERFRTIDKRLERIEGHVLTLLQWRWMLTGAVALAAFVATMLAGWLR